VNDESAPGQERSVEVPEPFKPLSTTEAIAAIDAVIQDYPPEVGNCFGLGTELGLCESQVIWTARNELLAWWLATPETAVERRRQFDEIRERVQRLDIVRRLTVSFYSEPIQSGFIDGRTHDVTELEGERWRIAFYPAIKQSSVGTTFARDSQKD
jgi:hypothetical protein